jgi:hypothetical protein
LTIRSFPLSHWGEGILLACVPDRRNRQRGRFQIRRRKSSNSASSASLVRFFPRPQAPTASRSLSTRISAARQIAVWLAGDPATWLVLLERPEASIRRTAARQLTALRGEPIAVDPTADPKTQARQRAQLRAKFEPLKHNPQTKAMPAMRMSTNPGPRKD